MCVLTQIYQVNDGVCVTLREVSHRRDVGAVLCDVDRTSEAEDSGRKMTTSDILSGYWYSVVGGDRSKAQVDKMQVERQHRWRREERRTTHPWQSLSFAEGGSAGVRARRRQAGVSKDGRAAGTRSRGLGGNMTTSAG